MKVKKEVKEEKKPVEVVVFHNRKQQTKTNHLENKANNPSKTNLNLAKKKENETDDKKEMSLKEAKFDVFKYGIKGLSKEDQETAKMQHAIRLGAKAPKNKYENYKEILQRKQEEKAKKLELLKEDRLFESKIFSVSTSSPQNSNKITSTNTNKSKQRHNKKAKISKGDVGRINGHIGSFSDGILKLHKFELKKLNNKKAKK